ncbi:hypothetical protein VTJ83DRAFT_6866 [Remersonia thermophila]|uniref:Uncharacterized protein n=1 Tax=Remersonia thermophila TaxID=72144 RepID=A0ABR4D5Y4_9PEZI
MPRSHASAAGTNKSDAGHRHPAGQQPQEPPAALSAWLNQPADDEPVAWYARLSEQASNGTSDVPPSTAAGGSSVPKL